MKLSAVLDKYLLTSVSEGTNLVYWTSVGSEVQPIYSLSFTDADGYDYEADFDDQEVTWTSGSEFVISCDGQPWAFAAWRPAND